MSLEAFERDSRIGEPAEPRQGGPLDDLPRFSSRQVRLEERLRRQVPKGGLPTDLLGPGVVLERVEVLWRNAGSNRPGLVVQASWPTLATRLAVGVETSIAHAVVDRLLGFDRLEAEGRLQLTPVEWGVWTFLVARGLARWRDVEGPLGRWDLVLDRVGPDPFDVTGLGPIVTLRWPVRIGPAAGSLRLWLPTSLAARWLAAPLEALGPVDPTRYRDLTGTWRAEVGEIDFPRADRALRPGMVLPLPGSMLQGNPRSPTGSVELALAASHRGGRWILAAEPLPYSGGARPTVTAPLQFVPTPREALALDPTPAAPSTPANLAPTDVPVTLTVELGRINLSIGRLADLRPGDVLELGRHSREPVELTSGGRLVARGELVQIDTELGVRVTSAFL